MNLTTVLLAANSKHEDLQRQTEDAQRQVSPGSAVGDKVEACFNLHTARHEANRKSLSKLKSKYDHLEVLSKDAGYQAVATFKASPGFSELVTSTIKAQHLELGRAWLRTKERQDWHDEEVLSLSDVASMTYRGCCMTS
ncbi:unnamed protein product [Cuscuta epithymum]|uniref:Uncharacterized protein n=1 Tax=Cuscuta epithymum TaxID=186058 RepID=A0AAV0G7P9_9ASTE|nr:unnamed protein product [Cuscuta epithymum]CAH9144009.1 unnamed protein product [Cuscuta epithymum]